MKIKDHKILLTVYLGGRLDAPVSNVSSKSMRSRIITSPFENVIVSKKGINTEKYVTPQGHFKAPNDYTERGEILCSRKSTLSEQVVNYLISNGSCPHSVNSKKWEKMDEKTKLEIQLKLTAEGRDFKYEII